MPNIHLEAYMWAGLFSMAGMLLKFVANMSYSLRDISAKITQFHDILKDHEERIRVVEKQYGGIYDNGRY